MKIGNGLGNPSYIVFERSLRVIARKPAGALATAGDEAISSVGATGLLRSLRSLAMTRGRIFGRGARFARAAPFSLARAGGLWHNPSGFLNKPG